MMNVPELLYMRLQNQLLGSHELKEPQDIVSWMGAMQSQTFDLARWAIGIRLQSKSVEDVNEALNTGKIIRTHILRPTWHFVSADDFYWMFDLSNPRLKSACRSSCKIHKADESLIYKCIPVVEKALLGGKHLIKQEIVELLSFQGFSVDNQFVTLVLSCAEIEGVLVNGRLRGSKHTYTLVEEWNPRKKTLHRDEALLLLARKYFTSHGPATIQDFTWWSGLTLTECRKALEMAKEELVCERVNGRDFWLRSDSKIASVADLSTLLLPPFDEYVVSYKDRSEFIEEGHYGKVMTKNGLFSPTVMLDGEIVGSWKKTAQKEALHIDLSFFEKQPWHIEELFHPVINRLRSFYCTEE